MKFSQNALVGMIIVSVTLLTIVLMMLLHRFLPEPKNGFIPRFNEDGTTITSSSVLASEKISSLASSVAANCPEGEDRQKCLEKTVLGIVDSYGPVEAVSTLTFMMKEGTMHGKGDYHDFVHRIGRQTAKKEGLNPDGFFLCPVDYNYGCQHGFFEQALVEEPDAVKAAKIVCDETRMNGRPLKFFFYCYHGVGHGVMMAKAYDLDASLIVCDEFSQQSQNEGCQQGVFMEAVVGHMNGTGRREGVFSDTNKIAPCDRLAEKYQRQCYINLGGYLAAYGGRGPGAVERATAPCLKADPTNIHICLKSLGLTSTNPGWQEALTPVYTDDLIKNAVSICQHFPKGYENDCIEAGIENLAQFDRSDTTRMVQFCLAVDDPMKTLCFTHIGPIVRDELPAGTSPEIICSGVPEEYRPLCMKDISPRS